MYPCHEPQTAQRGDAARAEAAMLTELVGEAGAEEDLMVNYRPQTTSLVHYRRDRRHPAARASASVQNQRSPFAGLMRVLP